MAKKNRKRSWWRLLRRRSRGLRYAFLDLFIKGICSLFPLLPHKMALGIGAFLGLLAGRCNPRIRQRMRRHLKIAFGQTDDRRGREKLIDRVFQNFGRSAVELALIYSGKGDRILERCRIENFEQVEPWLHDQKSGAIGLTAHFGNWEVLPLLFSRELDCEFGAVGRSLRESRLNRFIVELRQRSGARVFERGQGGRHYLRFLLKRNVLGVLGDIDTLSGDGIFVDYFGRPAWTQRGIADLAWLAKVPIVPIFIERETRDPSRHVARCYPVIPPPPPDAEREAWCLQTTQAFTRAIEDSVRRRPDLWAWMHKRWRQQPGDPEKIRRRRKRHAALQAQRVKGNKNG